MSASNESVSKEQVAEVLAQSLGAGLTEKTRKKLERFAFWFVESMPEDARGTLSRSLSEVPELSRELATRIAMDDAESVAVPFIEATEALSDDDWIALLDNVQDHAVSAMARREAVSQSLSEAIVETGSSAAITALVNNDGADLSSETTKRVIQENRRNADILRGLARRGDLTKSATEYLSRAREQMSEKAKQWSETQAALAEKTGEAIEPDQPKPKKTPKTPDDVNTAKEEQLLNRLDQFGTDSLPAFVHRMHASGRLTDLFILAAAKKQAWKIVDLGLSARTRMNLNIIQSRLQTGNTATIEDLLGQAKVDQKLISITCAACKIRRG